MSTAATEIEDLKKDITLIVAVVGGVIAGLVAIVIVMVAVICVKVSKLKKRMDLSSSSIRSIQKDINQTNAAIDRFPKNIVQFPMTPRSVADDDDRAGTEPASPIFIRKGFSPTPLASSLQSVTEVPGLNQVTHHHLQRNNAMLGVRQKGPPVPPKRAQSFNTHQFQY